MNRGPFRPSVRDPLDRLDRLGEQVRVVPSRMWVLIGVQVALLGLLLAWGLLGRLPVMATGEAVYVGGPGLELLVSLERADARDVRLGAPAVLEPRDRSRPPLRGKVVAGPGGGDHRRQVAEAEGDPRARVAVALEGAAVGPRLRPGERLSVRVTLREESPLARVLAGWWR